MTDSSQNYICLQGFIPVRKVASEESEMVTQILFGETIEVIEQNKSWLFIRSAYDGYEGWADRKTLTTPVSDNPAGELLLIAVKNTFLENVSSGETFMIPAGSVVPAIKEHAFSLANKQFRALDPDDFIRPGMNHIKELYHNILGTPYIWGGRSGFGFDCSGLTQYFCRIMGLEIPRDASQQAGMGEIINFLNETRSGDLAFFDNEEGEINHTGVLLAADRILHASGRVRVDHIDQQGIYNTETATYTHKLRIIKRLG